MYEASTTRMVSRIFNTGRQHGGRSFDIGLQGAHSAHKSIGKPVPCNTSILPLGIASGYVSKSVWSTSRIIQIHSHLRPRSTVRSFPLHETFLRLGRVIMAVI